MVEQQEVLALLRRAQNGALYGDVDTYDACMARARQAIEAHGSPAQLLGEWVFASRMDCLLRIDRLLETLERAASLIGGRAQTADNIPLTNGGDSILMAFIGPPGHADANRDKVRRIVELYISLTGTGYGFDMLYDAELHFYRGELDRAAVLAHQIVFTARNTGQNALLMCAAKMLASVAKHRVDEEGWKEALGILTDAASQDEEDLLCKSLALTTRIELLVQLGDFASLPKWFRAGDFGMIPGKGLLGFRYRSRDRTVNYINLPLQLWSYTLYLYQTGQFERMRAVLELQRSFGISQSALAYEIYYSQVAGLDALQLGNTAEAEAAFSRAIDIVAADGLWLCIAEFSSLSKGFVQELLRKRGQKGYPHLAENFTNLIDRVAALREDVQTHGVLGRLTAREREIALLAAQGMRNSEIAQKLSVTEQTVKFHLSNVYAKLAINNRNRLAALVKDIMT